MKLLLLLILSLNIYSQNVYISAGFDVRNLVIGSEATRNKSELDYILRFGMIGSIPKHTTVLEAQIGYERFEAIQYDRFFFGVGVHFPLYAYIFGEEIKTTLIPTIEPSLIGRWGNWGGGLGEYQQNSSHLTIGVSLALRYEISRKFSIEAQSGVLPRIDLNTMYGGDNYIVNTSLSVLYRL